MFKEVTAEIRALQRLRGGRCGGEESLCGSQRTNPGWRSAGEAAASGDFDDVDDVVVLDDDDSESGLGTKSNRGL